MLSFRIENDEIKVYCDQKGMDDLIRALERLKADGDHIHLWSQSYLGRDLEDKTPWGDPAAGTVAMIWCEGWEK